MVYKLKITMTQEPRSSCCNAKGMMVGRTTVSNYCSKCDKPFIPSRICHLCGILRGNGAPKGLRDEVEEDGECGWCGRKGKLVHPAFYNIKK